MSKKTRLVLCVVAIFVFILVVLGGTNIYKSSKMIESQINSNFIYLADEIAESQNEYFSSAEEEAERCRKVIELTINKQKLREIAPFAYNYNQYQIPYISDYLKTIVSPLLLYSTNHVDGLIGLYFNFNYEFLNHKELIGPWYVKDDHSNKFNLAYNGFVTDMFPVNDPKLAWFYNPKRLKKGAWTLPYKDRDLGSNMITYSTPVYLDKTFIGVVGVDISTNKVRDYICSIKVNGVGNAYLIDKNNKIIFSKNYASSTSTETVDKNLYNFLKNPSEINEIYIDKEKIKIIKSSSGKKLFAVTKLNNGFILVLDVPVKKLYEEINRLIAFMECSLLLAILISLLVAIEAYAKVKKINNELMHKEKLISMGTMAAEVAHEINNPIGYISCNLDTLRKFVQKIKDFIMGCENEVNKIFKKEVNYEDGINKIQDLKDELKINYVIESLDEIIDESKDGIKRVSDIVLNLKNFSKDDSKDNKSAESLEKIIDDSLLILGNKITKNNIQIIKLFGNIPPINCYKSQLKQVVTNMVDNAYYSLLEKGHENKKIIISTYKKGKNAYIEIEDNGTGIEKKKLDKIFDSFYTTKAKSGGTGLGLSIAYEIITNKHKGEILVESKKNLGTKFMIKIPY